ncbi:MAG: helix-turn-helix domain-containing protein [Bacteroidales bacterium]
MNSIHLIKYNKTDCGVDFLLNTGQGSEVMGIFTSFPTFKTDYFEFLFFRKASGYLLLGHERIELFDNMLLFISPYQQQEWHVDEKELDYTFLIFQEEFLYIFLSDKFFTYRLLYCYQSEYPTFFGVSPESFAHYCELLDNIKKELTNPVADSYQMILAWLYQFLILLNRLYAKQFSLPFNPPKNNYAFRFKQLLEKHIRVKQRVADYADLLHISRITLNKAVEQQFGVTASHLLKQRLLQEVKNELLFSGKSIKEVADQLLFSEATHLMRFFKREANLTITEFIAAYQNGRL